MAGRDRYLIVIPSLTLGGTEKEALQYAQSIMASGLGTPLVIGLGRDGELRHRLNEAGIACGTFHAAPFMNGNRLQKLTTLVRWWRQLVQWRPHTIIGMTYWPNLLCGLMWKLTGAQRFIWVQFSVDQNIPLTLWERIAARSRPRYVANGSAGKEFITARHRLRSDAVRIIPNALTLPALENRTVEHPEQVKLLMTANFFPEKDHATVLRALATFLQRADAPPVHLHFAGAAPGRSPQMAETKALAFDLGLCGKVTFHGTVNDVRPLLQQADIGILSTRSEGMSNAILEYMAHRLPVIATDILANREALGEQNAEWLFPVGDVERLTDLINAIIAHPDRATIGQRNRAYVEGRHALAIFDRCLKEVLSAQGSNRSV
jgi:glycosyltransferase involved in cell wall biosynthesis